MIYIVYKELLYIDEFAKILNMAGPRSGRFQKSDPDPDESRQDPPLQKNANRNGNFVFSSEIKAISHRGGSVT
jgi:hypothetical protein